MSQDRHFMVRVDGSSRESLFRCTTERCGRRVVLDHVDARLVVLEPGSGGALHSGSTGPGMLDVESLGNGVLP